MPLIVGTNNSDDLFGVPFQTNTIRGLGANDTLTGQSGTDYLDGGPGADLMQGGLGDDFYYVDQPGDVIIDPDVTNLSSTFNTTIESIISFDLSTLGTNRLTLNLRADSITGTGSNGNDFINSYGNFTTLIGGNGNDVLKGGYNSVVYGNQGEDQLQVGSNGVEVGGTLIGGTGNDNYLVNSIFPPSLSSPLEINELTGGGGIDTVFTVIDFNLSGQPGVNILGSVENLTLYVREATPGDGGLGGPVSGTGNGLNNRIIGNRNHNILSGLNGNDFISASFGNDYVEGGNGNDTLVGDNGNDILLGGANNDILGGGEGNDTLDGGGDNDTLNGGNGDDFLLGANGNDTLNGNNGNDTLNGGAGTNLLQGGADDDVYFLGNNTTTLVDTEGNNTVFTSVSWTVTSGLIVSSIFVNAQGAIAVNASALATDVFIGIPDDIFSTLANTFTGGAGNDTLNGKVAVDNLTGGDGIDTFAFGGLTFDGSGLVPLIANGIGSTSIRQDIVNDFTPGTDKIQLNITHTFGAIVGNGSGGLLPSEFFAGNFGAANTGMGNVSALIVYNTFNGALAYNADGLSTSTLGASGGTFATLLSSPGISSSDFTVV